MSISRLGETRLPAVVTPKGSDAEIAAPSKAAAAAAGAEGPSPFAQLLHGLGREINQGEATMRGAVTAAGSAHLSAAELIGLQASVYRYSEAIDLASRLVDRTTSGVKTVIQGGGQ
jgi:hypothetical protein